MTIGEVRVRAARRSNRLRLAFVFLLAGGALVGDLLSGDSLAGAVFSAAIPALVGAGGVYLVGRRNKVRNDQTSLGLSWRDRWRVARAMWTARPSDDPILREVEQDDALLLRRVSPWQATAGLLLAALMWYFAIESPTTLRSTLNYVLAVVCLVWSATSVHTFVCARRYLRAGVATPL